MASAGLTLTVMLVMYTMYQSINESIPKTAYLKFIDIWIGCCLFIPFIVFFIQIGWKLWISKSSGNVAEINDETKGLNRLATPQSRSHRKIWRMLAACLTLAFILTYFATAYFIYHNN